MSDGMLHSFWSSLERAEQRVEAQARDAQRSLYRTLYGYENRVMRLRWALEASGPLARKEIEGKLKKVSLDAVWPILLSVVKDIALYYGGSVVLGTAVGAGVGALFFGVGAIPGAALGFEAGMVLGEWVMMYLGLKMLAEGMIDTIPPAMNCYVEGFRAAWGPTDSDRPDARYLAGYAPSKETAAQRFAQGHVLMIMAILIAIVAYLMRGKSEKALLKAVGDSKRLGSKMADWLEDNKANLLKEESLQPKVRVRPEEPKEQAPSSPNERSGQPKAVRPLNPSTRFYASSDGQVLDANTYARNSGFRKGVRDEVWKDAVDDSTGLVKDPLSGATMNKDEPWDMGHRPGMEYWKERDNAINDWLDNREYTSRKEFLDIMNDPSRYRPELPSSNRSHLGEDASNDFWE